LGKIVKPKIIPKIDFYHGIDKDNTTIVVIPTIIKRKQKVQELMKKLEVFYLANKSENLHFCLLGDCSQSNKEIEEYDVYRLTFEYSDIKIADTEVRNNSLEAIDKEYSDKVHYHVVSKDNRDIEKIFGKYSGKIIVNFKNKQFLEKI
jgi:hypothetical protein